MKKFKPWGKDGYIVSCDIKELTNIPAIYIKTRGLPNCDVISITNTAD